MATEKLVIEQFQFLGIINIQKEVLSKCVSLCEEYNVDAETFVEQWMAFSLNHLSGAQPSLENLDIFERKEFSKRTADRLNASVSGTTNSNTGTNLIVYGAPISTQSENEVLSNYVTTTSKITNVETETISNHQNELQPATYSPTVSHSAKYTSRTNAGAVILSYGEEKLLQIMTKPMSLNDVLDLNITVITNEDGDTYTNAKFGFELLHEKAGIFDNHISYISKCVMKKAGITESTSVRQKTQAEVSVAGRIDCDADARLNSKCVVLQGTWEESFSQTVPVNIDNLKQYSMFPGQVVVLKGMNTHGNEFIAHEMLCDASQPIPGYNADMQNTLKGKMSVVLVAGPYTSSDNMAYEPWKDLITYINTYKPHVVIMMGPFMDSEHAKIKDNSMAETFKSFFEKLIDNLGELVTTSPLTRIYIVSSLKDAFHVNIYPTPPYTSKRKHSNICFVPDPCTLNINGVVFGVTSTDILMHISQEEISFGMVSDKLARLAGHILTQQSYYPLWPPPPGHAVDAALWVTHAQLPCTPHVLVLPSVFRYFVKEVNGCVAVNPEHLTKGTGGGTFARLLVSTESNTSKQIAAQIVRV